MKTQQVFVSKESLCPVEAYSEPVQTSKIEIFAKMFSAILTIFSKALS